MNADELYFILIEGDPIPWTERAEHFMMIKSASGGFLPTEAKAVYNLLKLAVSGYDPFGDIELSPEDEFRGVATRKSGSLIEERLRRIIDREEQIGRKVLANVSRDRYSQLPTPATTKLANAEADSDARKRPSTLLQDLLIAGAGGASTAAFASIPFIARKRAKLYDELDFPIHKQFLDPVPGSEFLKSVRDSAQYARKGELEKYLTPAVLERSDQYYASKNLRNPLREFLKKQKTLYPLLEPGSKGVSRAAIVGAALPMAYVVAKHLKQRHDMKKQGSIVMGEDPVSEFLEAQQLANEAEFFRQVAEESKLREQVAQTTVQRLQADRDALQKEQERLTNELNMSRMTAEQVQAQAEAEKNQLQQALQQTQAVAQQQAATAAALQQSETSLRTAISNYKRALMDLLAQEQGAGAAEAPTENQQVQGAQGAVS
jgi:hypothetical protein